MIAGLCIYIIYVSYIILFPYDWVSSPYEQLPIFTGYIIKMVKIPVSIFCYDPACSSGERSKFTAQMRPVATAVASGSLTSLAFSLARDILRGPLELSISPSPSFPPLTSELCTFIRPQPDWHLDFYSVLVGIFVGLSLNVFVDLLIVLRIQWTRFLQVRLAAEGAATRPLYRVLA